MMKKAGFTMIELLIVIAVLGVLATAVLSAINPIEQINRGRDTGNRSDAEQFLSAVERFYTMQKFYPWQVDDKDVAHAAVTPITEIQALGTIADTNEVSILTKISSMGGTSEVRQPLIDRMLKPTYHYLWLYFSGDSNDNHYVCFLPQSASFTQEAKTRCENGLPPDLISQAAVVCNVDASIYLSCLP